MSILVSSKSLRSAKLARIVEAREHFRRWNLCFWFRDHGWVLMIHHICGGGGAGTRGLVLEIVNKLAGGGHTYYNGRDKGSRSREGELTPKTRPQFGLQATTRLYEVETASNRLPAIHRDDNRNAEGLLPTISKDSQKTNREKLKLRVRSLENFLEAFWSPAILKPLCLRGQEWKERFAKESCGAVKGFLLRFSTLQVSTYLWNTGGSLILRCQGDRRRPQVEATDALIIQLTPCCQSVLAVMLAKIGKGQAKLEGYYPNKKGRTRRGAEIHLTIRRGPDNHTTTAILGLLRYEVASGASACYLRIAPWISSKMFDASWGFFGDREVPYHVGNKRGHTGRNHSLGWGTLPRAFQSIPRLRRLSASLHEAQVDLSS
ncbi:hypothetical protein H5410_040154 [Solanum commersonii]|uniref:Uncharacterized protein n=1 Tax=Solanum commersonii TaxID=4109 RepID=A0A9J5XR93_SOLCO|nr:hypothetical protein H5410_040154 [Solanum commersonii]